jgi:two-component system, NarL family, sensor histidine kinase UhpB
LHSLRLRLVLIPTIILTCGLLTATTLALRGASARIHREVASSVAAGRVLVQAALHTAEGAADPREALQDVEAQLLRIRHLDIAVIPGEQARATGLMPLNLEDRPKVPSWFERLLQPSLTTDTFPVIVRGTRVGQVLLRPNPDDEISEIWTDLRSLALLIGLILTLIVALLFIATTLSLRPLRLLADNLDELEHGRFESNPVPIRLRELQRISERCHSLGQTLRRLSADNHLLIDKLISLQEAERREVAQELHDEFGPALFAIRAEISSIMRRCVPEIATKDDKLSAISARAATVAELVDGIQHTNARMLTRLRPLVLEEMGIEQALRQLVASWQQLRPEVAWSLELSCSPAAMDGAVALVLFRLVQECLTNAARHAGARTVDVRLQETPCGTRLQATISDDGCGFDHPQQFGYGLLGMTERVRSVGGQILIRNGASGGATINASLPWRKLGRTNQ